MIDMLFHMIKIPSFVIGISDRLMMNLSSDKSQYLWSTDIIINAKTVALSNKTVVVQSRAKRKSKRMSNTRVHPLSWFLSDNRLEKVHSFKCTAHLF